LRILSFIHTFRTLQPVKKVVLKDYRLNQQSGSYYATQKTYP
jgi:hypothetical protein